METQLYQDRFGAIMYDAAKHILELRWFADTEGMTENDFRAWLERYATAAEQHHGSFALIDTQAFKYHPAADFLPWRDERIIPHYNRAGIKKFAFLLAEGSAPNSEPAPEGPALFPTGYFDSRERIERWFTPAEGAPGS
jgi:hypothetical protein